MEFHVRLCKTYWEVGQFVSERLHSSRWGEHAVDELASYLKRVNPKRKGYGKRNLYNMVKFFDTYSTIEFAETVEQLELTEFVQSGNAQFQPSQVPAILFVTTGNLMRIQLERNSF